MANLATLKPHKVAKTQNRPKPIISLVKHTIGNKYTDFQPNLSIFEGPVTFSVEKKFRNRDVENALNDRFSAKNQPILKIFQKSSGI